MLKKNQPTRPSTFAQRVLTTVQAIAPGTTLSYQEVAALAGNRKASRAVARLMSQNYDTTIPCHRVIYSNGRLGHYNRGGEEKKRELLLAEGWHS